MNYLSRRRFLALVGPGLLAACSASKKPSPAEVQPTETGFATSVPSTTASADPTAKKMLPTERPMPTAFRTGVHLDHLIA